MKDFFRKHKIPVCIVGVVLVIVIIGVIVFACNNRPENNRVNTDVDEETTSTEDNQEGTTSRKEQPTTVDNGQNSNNGSDGDVTDYGLADNTNEGAILHCWNWSYNNIKEHMQEIAQAGFSSIQTSPVQQAKDYTYEGKVYTNVGTPNGTGGSDGQWWKLYQPVSFNICDNGQSFLGTKQEFIDMCNEADKYGIKVIVDVVTNHMGNIKGWQNSMSDISPQVGTYCNEALMTDETYWHINDMQCWMSDGREHLTQGTIGMPDLNTADERVQQMVLDFLKECVDCGADGFRFDAAKHIETPDDNPAFASDFWPNVINGIREYAPGELFIYGEILNSPGDNFSISNYTKYMSVTDSATGDNRRNDVRYKNAGSAANSGYSYDAQKVVVWNESHDTYVGSGSSYLATDTMIKQTWAIVASRKDATPLYLARPYYSENLVDENGNKKSTLSLVQTNMGDVGTMTWSDPSVAAVNNFKNAFIGQSESVSSTDSIVYIERGNSGIVIVNLNGAGNVSLKVKHMADGEYTDRVSGNKFTVSGGNITGKVESSDGIAVVYNTDTVPAVNVSVPGGTVSTDTFTVTISLSNAVSGTYCIDDGQVYNFSEETSITLGENTEYGGHIKLTVTASDGENTYTYKHIYNKNKSDHEAQIYDESTGKYHIYMKNTAGWEDVYCYMWIDSNTNNQGWPGLKMTDLGDGVFLYSTDVEYPNVIFTDGNGTQTADLIWEGNDSIYYNKEKEWGL
ncbi:MAG: alpha-amylase family glycosyl hydrolase, partial [Butyrivibrio sp.]